MYFWMFINFCIINSQTSHDEENSQTADDNASRVQAVDCVGVFDSFQKVASSGVDKSIEPLTSLINSARQHSITTQHSDRRYMTRYYVTIEILHAITHRLRRDLYSLKRENKSMKKPQEDNS